VPFYINLRKLDSKFIRERFGCRTLDELLKAPAFRLDAAKGSAARAARIRKIELRPRDYDAALSTNWTLVPFAAARAKDGTTVLRALRNEDYGPSWINWDYISRGSGNTLNVPPGFDNRVHNALSKLPKGSNVLVIGTGFGKPILEYQKAHPGLNVLGLDAHDWAHALSAIDDAKLRRNAALIRNRTIIADASPPRGRGARAAKHIPFRDKTIDLVVMHPCTFMYFRNPLRTFSELFRITKDGGRIIGDFSASNIEFFREPENGAGRSVSLPEVLEGHFGAAVDVLQKDKYYTILSVAPGRHDVRLPKMVRHQDGMHCSFAVRGRLPEGYQIFKDRPGQGRWEAKGK
jgi:SAM-dependent methyltransferase